MMVDSDKVMEAAAFAVSAHGRTTRKDGTTPYVVHPLRVATSLNRVFGLNDDKARIVALLHDTVEDTSVTLDEIRRKFGRWIAVSVDLLTHDDTPEGRARSLSRLTQEIDPRVRIIKLADVYDNLSDAGEVSEEFLRKVIDWGVKITASFDNADWANFDCGAEELEKNAIGIVRARIADILSGNTKGVPNG